MVVIVWQLDLQLPMPIKYQESCHGRDRMVGGYINTYAISDYHHKRSNPAQARCTRYNIIYLLTGYEGYALLLSPRYQLFSEATPRTIVGTEGTMKVLLLEQQVYKCFIVLNNCAIQNSKLQALFWWICSLLYQCLFLANTFSCVCI